MIYLGVDLGTRRIGLAVADDECPVATMLKTLHVDSPAAALAAIQAAWRETNADVAVVGLPLDLNGRRGLKAREAEQTAEQLRAAGINVVLWDERLTTEEVRRTLVDAGISRKNRNACIDAMAAQRILSSYLDAQQQSKL